MNIFFLDVDPETAAQKQVNKSLVKMVLETAQILSDAVKTYGYTGNDVYKGSYHNHPSVVWARRNRANFEWLCHHGIALAEEYTRRYQKSHKSEQIIWRCYELIDLLPQGIFKLNQYDLAIKSTPEGLAALNSFQKSSGSFQDAVNAYTKFYEAKDYVIEARSKVQCIH